jgi:hypothetical protein
MKYFIGSIFLFLSCLTQAQNLISNFNNNIIYYIFPENVKYEIINYFNSDTIHNSTNQYYCYLKEDADTVTLMITSYHKGLTPKLDSLISMTDRYLDINDNIYPIIFRFDLLFSNITNTYAEYNGILVIESITMTGGGFYIKFVSSPGDLNGEILEFGYVQ